MTDMPLAEPTPAPRDPIFDVPEPTDAEVQDAAQKVRAEMHAREEGFDIKDLGFPDLTPEDLDYLETRAASKIDSDEVKFGRKNIPFVGVGFEVGDILEHQQAEMAIRAGTATREQQLLAATSRIDQQREYTGFGEFQQYGIDAVTMGSEMALSYAGGAGAASVGTRVAARAGLKLAEAATSTMLLRRATELGLLTAGREAIPRTLGHEGGGWTAASLKRALPDMEISDEDAESLAAMSEAQFADVFLGKAFEQNSIYRGLAEDLASSTLEKAVGPALGKITLNGALKAFQGRVMQKLSKGVRTPGALAAKLRDVTAVNTGITEVGEEVIQNMAIEQFFGENMAEGLPESWQQLMAIFAVGSVPGTVGTAVETLAMGRMKAKREAARGEAKPEPLLGEKALGQSVQVGGKAGTIVGIQSTTGTVGDDLTPDPSQDGEFATVKFADGTTQRVRTSELSATAEENAAGVTTSLEGGDASAPVEATAATAGVEPGVSLTEVPQEALQSFASQAGIEGATQVVPRNEGEAEAVQMAKLLGREIVLVSGRGGRRASGMIDAEGRMFVHAETASPLGVAVHEMGHDLADKLGEAEFRKELEGLEAVAPGMVARYRDRWMRRNEASQARGENLDSDQRAASEQGLGPKDSTADLATEEGFTSLAEEYAALISYASTTQGRADVKVIAEHSPTIFRRMVDAVRKFVGKFKPDSPLGALDRIEKATRTRPDRAAAQLSLYLADLYKRGFGVQDAAAVEGGTQAGGTLLEQLQREAEARGIQVVRPEKRGSGETPAGKRRTPTGAATKPAPTAPADGVSLPATETGTDSGTQNSVSPSPTTGTDAVPVGGPGPLLNEDAVPRPDLNNPLPSPEQRAVLDEVDRQRNAEGLPEPQSRKEMRDFAKAELLRDYDGTRSEIETKIETGERLQPWEVHALIDILDGLTLAGFRGDKVAFADALRLGSAYRDIRSEAGRDLGSIVGRGRSAKDAVVDMILMATRSNRRKRAKIQKEVDGIMQLVSPFKNKRAKYLRTRHQMEQERKNDRFAPNRELKFAPGLLDERGKPVTEARLEFLQSQLEKIEADEAARVERAGEAVAALGYDLEALDLETLVNPYDGWRIRNAISIAKATKTDKFLELRYMNMLSGLATHARNTSGNASMLVLDGPIMKAAEATAQMALRTIDKSGKTQLADPEGATYQEILHWFKGFANAIPLAFKNMMAAYRTQGPAFEMELQASGANMGVYAHDFGSKLDYVPGPKIGPDGIRGKIATGLRHVSLNTLLASDEFFKTIAATAEVHSLAFRQAATEGLKGDARSKRMQELIDDRGSEIWTQGLYKAREITFQDEGGLATQKTAEVIQRVVGNLDDVFETYAKTPLGTILIPFRKTPLRIAGRALRLTPLQTAMLPARAIAGDYKGNQAALVRDLADAMLAWGLTFAIMELVDMEDDEGRPFITGPRSENRAESSLDYATNFPMSILVDGTYYDYSRFEPAATGLGMLVGVAEEFKKTGTTESLSAMLQSAVAQTKDKTFLRTIGDIMDLADSTRSGKDRTLGFLRDTFVTPLVPNIIRQTARESDDVLRERRTTDGGQAAFWLDGIYATAEDSLAKLTGAEAKEPRYTAWGEPIKRPFAKKGGTDTLMRLLSPIQPKLDTRETSRLDLALLTWERKVSSGEVEDARVYYPGRPSSSFKIDGEDYTMTPNEYARYVRTSGKAAAESILADRGINLDDPSEKDIDKIRRTVNKERASFRKRLEKERRALNTQ